MLKKIYSLPEVIKVRKSYIMVAHHPNYNDSHITITGNDYGMQPIPFAPSIVKYHKGFDIKMYEMSDYQRRKWQKLSGVKAYIYGLVNNGVPYYVGSTKNIKTRHSYHFKRFNKTSLKGTKIYRKGFQMIILCECPAEFQFKEERRWILGTKKNYKLKNIVYGN